MMHMPLFDLDDEPDLSSDFEPFEDESPLNYKTIANRKTLNQLYKLYWGSLEVGIRLTIYVFF